MSTPQKILEFWFGAPDSPEYGQYRDVWFQPDDHFINAAREGFAEDYQRAKNGELNDWQQTPQGALALVLLLDQFSNLLFRHGGRFCDRRSRAPCHQTRFGARLRPTISRYLPLVFLFASRTQRKPGRSTPSRRLVQSLATQRKESGGFGFRRTPFARHRTIRVFSQS